VRGGVLNIALDGLGETAHARHDFILPQPVVAFGADWIGLSAFGLEDV